MRFFKTKKEKIYIVRALKSKNVWPLFVYICYRLKLGFLFTINRDYYTIKLQQSPYSFWLYFHQKTERKEEEFVHAFVQPGDTVVDCGSHLGTVLLTAMHACRGFGQFYAFEAHPKTCLLSKENFEPYKGLVLLQNKAVGESEGIVRISSSYVSDMNHIGEHSSSYYEVKMVTLKKELALCHRISLLKLDVEGQEFPAIKGLGSKIKDIDALLFESSPAGFKRYGYTLSDCLAYLDLNGFSIYRIVDSRRLVLERVRIGYVTPVRYEDLIALSPHGKIRFQKKGGRFLPA